MSTRIGDKEPAQLHNDLFFLNAENNGVDLTLRTLYSGNGLALPIRISQNQLEVDAGDGVFSDVVLHSYQINTNIIGNKTGTYQISTAGGNLQKITLTGNVILSILSDIADDSGFEITLVVEQTSGGFGITFPATFKTTTHAPITFSPNASAFDILKLITFDGGSTWLVYKVASDLR